MRWQRYGLAVVTTLTLAVSVGCGHRSQDAAADVEPFGTPDNPLTPASFAATVTEAQLRAQTAHLRARVTDPEGTMAIDGDIALGVAVEEANFDLTFDEPEGGGRIIRIDQDLYVQLDGFADNKFIHVDLDDPDDLLAVVLQMPMDTVSPAILTHKIEEAKSVRRTDDTEIIDDVTARRFHVTTSHVNLFDSLCPSNIGLGRDTNQEVDIWVGDDMLPRRYECELTKATTTVELSEWNAADSVEPPADDEITEDPPLDEMPTFDDALADG